MHELSIVQGILGIIEKERKARGFTKVKSVEVQCGHYSCVSEESLKFCFEAVATDPRLKGASLTLVRMPAKFKCANCGAEFDAAEETPGKCPSCGAADPAPQIKSEILVRSLEVD
jgi:hydrogenase nickel incorporation protein HypA/HybF